MRKSRRSSKREMILIIVLAVILAGMVYYRFVEMTVSKSMEKAQETIETNQTEVDLSTAKLAQLKSMDKKLNDFESSGAGYLASYNNVKKEIQVLDRILKPTTEYSMSLSDPVETGDLIRRDMSIRFTTGNFAQTYSVLKDFEKCEYRNIVKDISYGLSMTREGKSVAGVNMNVTFYETIIGGEPDAGLIVAQVETPAEEEAAE